MEFSERVIMLSTMYRRLISVFMMVSFFTGILESQVRFTDSTDQLICQVPYYTVTISKSLFFVSVNNADHQVLKISGIISDQAPEDNSWQVTGCKSENNRVSLELTGKGGKNVSLLLELDENSLKVSITPSERTENMRLGLKFDGKASGHWYGGNVVKAHLWPMESVRLKVDPFYATSNQVSPVWLTSSGAGIFADTYATMGYSFNDPAEGTFEVWTEKQDRLNIILVIGKDIRDAFLKMADITGKPAVTPPFDFFAYPQFNTWIEFMTSVNQEGIMKYAGEIRKNNFPSKLFIIDDKWTSTYGDPEFDSKKFPDPEKMINFLHQNDFRIALWLTPFIEKKAKNFQYAADHNYLIMDPETKLPYLTEWWNGIAALVDLSNPEARSWFLGLMENLKKKYGVDGFKLDAGDAEYLGKPFRSFGKITANEYTDLFAELGTGFEANELRVSWRAQSMGLIQRLRDKAPSWAASDGINSLIPHALAAGLIGYTYVCPDMIGGGLDSGFKNKGYKMDEELFVRWTEASALMPMMQYSLAPWKLTAQNAAICRKYSDLHVSLGDYIYKLALQSRNDGTPVVRPLFFEFPSDEKTFLIKDEFMLGDRFLVAPVLEKGAVSRKIYLPESTWIDFWTGRVISGGQTIEYPALLDVLPVLIKVE